MRVFSIFLMSSMVTVSSWAGISLTNTRVIYPANEASVNVQLNNMLDKPALAQVWTDNGDSSEVPAAKDNPFLVTPPVSRLNAKANQIVRIMLKPNMQLAQDRESLYWFNLLDVPPLSKADEEKNVLQFSIRSRLKLIYRPENLSMSQQQAFKSLSFTQSTTKKAIEINNPSPYYITFNRLDFKTVQNNKISYTADVMVAPFSKYEVLFEPFKTAITHVNYELINDLGGYAQFEADIH
jgi:P pilus assembly chaperone PapD